MRVLLVFFTVALNTFQITNAVSDCKVCQLDHYFNDTTGYSCFYLNNGKVACTCPDRRYTIDKPCRICERENICGDNPNNLCSEISSTSFDMQNNNGSSFGCFCADWSFHLGKPCPSNPITVTATTELPTTSLFPHTTGTPITTGLPITTIFPHTTTS